MKKEDCFLLGRFGRLIGNKGEISIRLQASEPLDYKDLGSVFALMGEKLIPFFFTSCRLQGKDKLVVGIEDLNSREELQMLVGKEAYLPLQVLPTLEEGSFYLHELVGCTVKDKEQGDLGEVIGIINQTAQSLAEVSYQNKKYLIPLVDEIVIDFNKDNKQLFVNLPEGLLDLAIDN